jgi:hypothetical protein
MCILRVNALNMELEMIDGKLSFDEDFEKDTGLSPSANLTEYLLYCNLRMTARLNDRIQALESRMNALGGLVETLPEDFFNKQEDRRRRRNTL